LNDRNILKDAGNFSHEIAKELAEKEYDKFNFNRINQESNTDSDFEKAIGLIQKKKSYKKR
jgi:hypothetical protein